jgi:peptidoglycan/xylan/chitin deacetylase (PgdA/CDA1 family)
LPHFEHILCHCEAFLIFNYHQNQHQCALRIYRKTLTKADYFLPPYEWYNDSISRWTNEMNLKLINFTPGTKSNADYTFPELTNYKSSGAIYSSILDYEKQHTLNGFILLLHIGTDAKRKDKFYFKLNDLIFTLNQKGYSFKRIDELLN